jgi:hypothetical protein
MTMMMMMMIWLYGENGSLDYGLSRVRLRAADIVSRGLRMGRLHRGNGDDSYSADCRVPSGMTTVWK